MSHGVQITRQAVNVRRFRPALPDWPVEALAHALCTAFPIDLSASCNYNETKAP